MPLLSSNALKRILLYFLLAVASQYAEAQTAYQKALDSFCLSLMKVKIAKEGFMPSHLNADSLLGIHTRYRKYGSDTSRYEVEGTSIVLLHYKKHFCILDLDAYHPRGIVETDTGVVLRDTSHHIFANVKTRIPNHGYYHLSELPFELPEGMDKKAFLTSFQRAIRLRHRSYPKKKTKFDIEKYDSEYLDE